jgi:hypothetical protein
MPVELGKNYKIYIGDGAATEVFTSLGGQGSLSWQRAFKAIETSSKDNGIYGSAKSGLQNITMTVTGRLNVPDTAFEDLYNYSKSGTPEMNIEVRKGSTVKYKGKMSISGTFTADMPYEGAVDYSFDLTNVEAPVTDSLTA